MKLFPMHNLVALPDGKAVGEVLPAFAGVHTEIKIGSPEAICASCRKAFSAARKRRQAIRLYPRDVPIPICLQFWLCGVCVAQLRQGGAPHDGVLAAVEAYASGTEAAQ